jgi:hypothetical protein
MYLKKSNWVWRAHSDDKTAIERKTSENNNLAKIITEEI